MTGTAEPLEQNPKLWKALRDLSAGQVAARDVLLETLLAAPNPASALTELAVHEAGSPAARTQLTAHHADPKWSKWLPLHLQEYTAVFPEDARFHQPLSQALIDSGWAEAHLRALQASEEGSVQAARALGAELNAIAEEAASLLSRLPAMKTRLGGSLHILQVQALTRAEALLGPLQGRKILEVGPQEGGLLLELIRLGADALGIDLGPQIEHPRLVQGDFLHTALPGPFELIVATAVFESSSCARGEPDSDAKNNSPAVLRRFHELTAPGGFVVLENVMFPIPFSREEAEAAGFEVPLSRLPAINLRTGGRSCVLRRT
ncbi:hypothetical protein POL68_29545 [Stigmatella sp. ncwal1]|uniref:Methyltransferase domain-containing protein n=1 Tax=Stigmatella ashevillensis TaxID=2995309 RepID=A0ABT5DHS1_9BACT|nr:methyltransferase domain-containing protein [Stigmatella ashevillena]MDC0712644.1 hypothetical protein [Stigmatella ashevillena]